MNFDWWHEGGGSMVDGDEFRQHELGREEEISWPLGRERERKQYL